MSKISKPQFHEIRNSIYTGLIDSGIIEESDTTFTRIEELIIATPYLEIDWDDERPLDDDNDMEDKACHYLCDNSHLEGELTVAEQVKAIIKQSEIDGSTPIDYVEGVCVWEKVENTFDCDEFIDLIS